MAGKGSMLEPAYRAGAQRTIDRARVAAIRKHGELRGGMARWAHHLEEECGEAVREMWALENTANIKDYRERKVALIAELAQVAQLAQTMMATLYAGNEKEGEDTWEPKVISQL